MKIMFIQMISKEKQFKLYKKTTYLEQKPFSLIKPINIVTKVLIIQQF